MFIGLIHDFEISKSSPCCPTKENPWNVGLSSQDPRRDWASLKSLHTRPATGLTYILLGTSLLKYFHPMKFVPSSGFNNTELNSFSATIELPATNLLHRKLSLESAFNSHNANKMLQGSNERQLRLHHPLHRPALRLHWHRTLTRQ